MKLSEKALLVKLSISLPGNTRTDATLTQDTIAAHSLSKDSGRWLKQLYPDEAMKPLVQINSEVRTWHYENTLPWQDDGYRILPTSHHSQYVDKMRDFRRVYESARDTFISRLPDWLEWARKAHNGTFDPANYPSEDRLARKFGFDLDFSPVPSGADFRVDVSAEDLAAMQSQVDERVKAATESARVDLWQRLATPIRAMIDRLTADRANGKPAVFRDSLVTNLKDIVALIPALNVCQDPALETFAAEVREKLTALTPDALRASKPDREATAKAAADILARMAGYFPQAQP